MKFEFQALIFISIRQLATCVAAEANPAANITWLKNNKPLLADGNGMSLLELFGQNCSPMFLVCSFLSVFLCVFCVGVSIQASVQVDPVTGLSTTSSVLEYSAKKEDTNAQFTCRTVEEDLVSQPVTFTITCESPDPPKLI